MIGWLRGLPGWLPVVAAAVAGGLLVGAAQGWRYGERIASLQRDHAERLAEYSQRAERAQAAYRAAEQARVAAIEEIRNEADQEIAAAIERERAAGDVRVRDAVAEYARRHRPPGNPGTAQPGAPAGDPIGVLADVLGELDEMAGIYAAQADRARIAGLTCERAYDAIRGLD
ncbi:DUF2514 family protein [Orrella sp. JC864]|uniref:DUF2514 family protein n=1 Tax=Orrella sp. JC864 TaxID=3120298 RepID=UPI0030085C68